MISTIILNWNRAALLRKTVESYLETIKGGFELFIVDSASIDASHDYLRELDSQGLATVLFLEKNVGGDAFNRVLPLTRGDLVHFSANDLEFLPGWSEHAVAAFETFADLGQLHCLRTCRRMTRLGNRSRRKLAFRRARCSTRHAATLAPPRFLEPCCFENADYVLKLLKMAP
jgi:glycosyltransferase involved in cell wall biosynthesis